jgi:transcription elongation factor GreA
MNTVRKGDIIMESEKTFLTKEGVEKFQQELHHLIHVARPEVINELQIARAHGDLSENSDYDAAREKQAQIETRIKVLENALLNVEIIDEKTGGNIVVKLGSVVKIKDLSDKTVAQYKIVDSMEAEPIKAKISKHSPLGVAIINKKVGSICRVLVADEYDVEIMEIS